MCNIRVLCHYLMHVGIICMAIGKLCQYSICVLNVCTLQVTQCSTAAQCTLMLFLGHTRYAVSGFESAGLECYDD